jgi:hypothetical protein
LLEIRGNGEVLCSGLGCGIEILETIAGGKLAFLEADSSKDTSMIA